MWTTFTTYAAIMMLYLAVLAGTGCVLFLALVLKRQLVIGYWEWRLRRALAANPPCAGAGGGRADGTTV